MISNITHSTQMFPTSDQGPANHLAGHFSCGTSHSFVLLYLYSWSHLSSSTFITEAPSNRPQNTLRVCTPLPHSTEHCLLNKNIKYFFNLRHMMLETDKNSHCSIEWRTTAPDKAVAWCDHTPPPTMDLGDMNIILNLLLYDPW